MSYYIPVGLYSPCNQPQFRAGSAFVPIRRGYLPVTHAQTARQVYAMPRAGAIPSCDYKGTNYICSCQNFQCDDGGVPQPRAYGKTGEYGCVCLNEEKNPWLCVGGESFNAECCTDITKC